MEFLNFNNLDGNSVAKTEDTKKVTNISGFFYHLMCLVEPNFMEQTLVEEHEWLDRLSATYFRGIKWVAYASVADLGAASATEIGRLIIACRDPGS